MNFPKPASFRTAAAFREHLTGLGMDLPCDDVVLPAPDGPLARPVVWNGRRIGNRLAVLPMEGWDATPAGAPTELTERRWRRFGAGGAKLIWGGEAVAVRHDGRANPNQLLLNHATAPQIERLRAGLIAEHAARDATDDLVVGLQLTHSGRYARPNRSDRPEPRVLYRHPLLDGRSAVTGDEALLSDGEIDALIGDFAQAAWLSREAGFDFVDLKHCHGYLGHEFLSAVDRPGRFGGSFENRTRFLRELVAAIRREAPGLGLGVRLSLFDQPPFLRGPDGVGRRMPWEGSYPFVFGADPANPNDIAWDEPLAFLRLLEDLGVSLVCLTAGSPYYNPHLQRPAAQPPSDGYSPPEDPLAGVGRQIQAVALAKAACPRLLMVGSAYSYLQEWLGPVAQAQVRLGRTDFIGLGRAILSYPELPADLVASRPLRRQSICRTFSECTTGPRLGLVSGCFPLDPLYAAHPAAEKIKAYKAAARASRAVG